VKERVILVQRGATGTIPKSLRQYLSYIPGEHEIKELQNAAILGTAHILRKVLMYEYRTYFTGEITLHVAQIVNSEQLPPYYRRNMVCFRYIIINTLNNVMKIIIIISYS